MTLGGRLLLLRHAHTVGNAGRHTAARDVPVHVDQALVEMDFGLEIGTKPRPKPRLKKHHLLYHPVPGGESLFQVWQRAAEFFARVRPELDSGGTIVAVAH
jgi:broad specificity phosphatase PhoE